MKLTHLLVSSGRFNFKVFCVFSLSRSLSCRLKQREHLHINENQVLLSHRYTLTSAHLSQLDLYSKSHISVSDTARPWLAIKVTVRTVYSQTKRTLTHTHVELEVVSLHAHKVTLKNNSVLCFVPLWHFFAFLFTCSEQRKRLHFENLNNSSSDSCQHWELFYKRNMCTRLKETLNMKQVFFISFTSKSSEGQTAEWRGSAARWEKQTFKS